ncbi:NUDIX hydrolase [Phytoactinopolyspora mesophila]|uniref:NUDIX domain-containing protein n=1 Tax=Phytoactinopolyspora mesophila TaxID=2650750 RepID=A0A7K3MA65_9ACTN|nr:NUDIX domain-containing protein [Phytoactinopolyspora mesophila]NDL60184.1 NUDIX domain-containing protein [Phytoactinopolyspora mesophila]
MARIDYVDDPEAPAITNVVPSVTALIQDHDARILLIHKTDNDLWALPGGGHEMGESIRETVMREVKEETGYDVEPYTIVGTYTNPNHVMAYDNGEVRQQFSICFAARLLGGSQRTSEESKEVTWATIPEINNLEMHPSMRLRIKHYLDGREHPFIG